MSYPRRRESGFGMIEVFIALMIVMIGILGMAGLQGTSLTVQLEAYQRAQAMNLAKTMAARINANRGVAATYETGADNLGTGSDINCTAPVARKDVDLCEWHNLLLGAAETSGGSSVGAMIDARGCIYRPGGGSQYVVAVAWQGLTPTVAPSGDYVCGSSTTTHRLIILPLTIGNLAAPT